MRCKAKKKKCAIYGWVLSQYEVGSGEVRANQVGFQQAATQVIAIGFCVKDLSQAIGAE